MFRVFSRGDEGTADEDVMTVDQHRPVTGVRHEYVSRHPSRRFQSVRPQPRFAMCHEGVVKLLTSVPFSEITIAPWRLKSIPRAAVIPRAVGSQGLLDKGAPTVSLFPTPDSMSTDNMGLHVCTF